MVQGATRSSESGMLYLWGSINTGEIKLQHYFEPLKRTFSINLLQKTRITPFYGDLLRV